MTHTYTLAVATISVEATEKKQEKNRPFLLECFHVFLFLSYLAIDLLLYAKKKKEKKKKTAMRIADVPL